MWNSLALALRILTTLPSLSTEVPESADAKRAIILFPIIGALVGTVAGLVFLIAQSFWPDPLSHIPALLAALTTLAITGGRGPAGAARSSEALAGLAGLDRARAFALLRDPHAGPTGVVTATTLVIGRIVLIDAIPREHALQALVASSVLGYWATAMCVTVFPMPTGWNNDEVARGIGGAGMNEFLLVTGIAIVCVAVWPVHGMLAFVAAAAVAAPAAQTINRVLGGSFATAFGVGDLAALSALLVMTI